MGTDIFGGIFDSLRGFGGSIGDLFTRANDIIPISKTEESNLLNSNWSSKGEPSTGLGLGSLFAGLGQAAISATKAPQGTTKRAEIGAARVSVDEGKLYNTDVAVRASHSGQLTSPGDFEKEFLSRMYQFARLGDDVKQTVVKPGVR